MRTRRQILQTLALGGLASLAAPHALCAEPCRPSVAPTIRTRRPDLHSVDDSGVWLCWIGHSTVLMNVFGTWILTDPVMFDHYGLNILGLSIGPRRMNEPALPLEELPRPDLLLLSHAHMDHMDRRTLTVLSERYPGEIDVITAARTSDVVEDLSWSSLNEMDWGDRVSVNGITLHGLQVKHNGWRWPGEACRANGQPRTGRSYNGYYIERNGVGIVFGGDTAYTTSFKDVPGNVDVAIMPIGAYDPYPETHCTPEESLAMAEMMKARFFVPIHHSTFKQSEEPMTEPVSRLLSAMRKGTSSQLALHTVGETIGFDLG